MIREQLTDALASVLVAIGVDPPETIGLEQPARREHGDWSTNVAMVLSKAVGRNPRDLAGEIVQRLEEELPTHVTKVEIAGPGFVNFHLAPSWLHEVLIAAIGEGPDFGRRRSGAGRRVLLEFVSANPTGPIHAGHGRGASYGDSVGRLLSRCGYDVTREYYLNDRGVQMQNFAASLAARKAGLPPPEDGYHGQYIIDWASEMPDDADPLEWGEQRALDDHRATLTRMNVHFDSWFSERSMMETSAVSDMLIDLYASGMVYEADGATWFRTADYGDDKDRVLIKSDGDYTYLTPDIAYHRNKLDRGFDLLIDVFGADHHGYVARMNAAIVALDRSPEVLDIRITQMVSLMDGDVEVKLSKRSGSIIELAEILDEVGPDAARLTYLLQSVDSPLTFDFAAVKAEGMENPVYYIQMAYARVRSIQRKAAEAGLERLPIGMVDLGLLTHERELEVLRVLSTLGDITEVACRERAPHKISTWVRDLAGALHGFYADCYVISESVGPDLAQARLWLVESASIGLAIGLDLLGVSAPDRL